MSVCFLLSIPFSPRSSIEQIPDSSINLPMESPLEKCFCQNISSLRLCTDSMVITLFYILRPFFNQWHYFSFILYSKDTDTHLSRNHSYQRMKLVIWGSKKGTVVSSHQRQFCPLQYTRHTPQRPSGQRQQVPVNLNAISSTPSFQNAFCVSRNQR